MDVALLLLLCLNDDHKLRYWIKRLAFCILAIVSSRHGVDVQEPYTQRIGVT